MLHFGRQYENWVKELRKIPDTSKAITYDADKVQTSGGFDPCAEMAMRRHMIERKKKLVDDTVEEVAPEIAEYLLLGVGYGFTFYQLKAEGMPCEKDMYYTRRQRFYYELSRKI